MNDQRRFCGKCGTEYVSEFDVYCRLCGRPTVPSVTPVTVEPSHWNWRFLLVIPAFAIGLVVPGFLVRISTELGTLLPLVGGGFSYLAEFAQVVTDGFCSVTFSQIVAPSGKYKVSVIAGLLVLLSAIVYFSFTSETGYYLRAGEGTVVWETTLVLASVGSAGIAVIFADRNTKRAV